MIGFFFSKRIKELERDAVADRKKHANDHNRLMDLELAFETYVKDKGDYRDPVHGFVIIGVEKPRKAAAVKKKKKKL